MKKNNTTKIVVTVVVLLIAVIFTLPSTPLWDSAFGTLSPDEQKGMPIDLFEYSSNPDGSILLTMTVNTSAQIFTRKNPANVDDFLDRISDIIRQKLIKKGYKAESQNINLIDKKRTLLIKSKESQAITIDKLKSDIKDSNLYAKYDLLIASFFPSKKMTMGLDLKGGLDIVYQVELDSNNNSGTDAVNRTVEIIRSRIDKYGIAEPSIKAQEGNRIRIQIPGSNSNDAIEIKKTIEDTAKLEFHIVKDQSVSPTDFMPGPNDMVCASKNDNLYYLLERNPSDVTGEHLSYAKVARDEMNQPVIHLEFNAEGQIKFGTITRNNVGRQLAIVLSDFSSGVMFVHSAPRIQTAITGGNAQITGGFSLEEAKRLALTLRSGALPATLRELESSVVGPTLGEKSVKAGFLSGFLGFALVMIYMLVFYKSCGFIADVALIFNSLIVFASLVIFGGTMTLPGIAGFILSLGMAVDANIIIFERIREEYHSGKTTRASIASGFDRAFSCILDSNVTTLLVVAILYYFTTGSVRGFATTLGIGLIANLYTAVAFSKFCLESWFIGHPERKLGL